MAKISSKFCYSPSSTVSIILQFLLTYLVRYEPSSSSTKDLHASTIIWTSTIKKRAIHGLFLDYFCFLQTFVQTVPDFSRIRSRVFDVKASMPTTKPACYLTPSSTSCKTAIFNPTFTTEIYNVVKIIKITLQVRAIN